MLSLARCVLIMADASINPDMLFARIKLCGNNLLNKKKLFKLEFHSLADVISYSKCEKIIYR